MAKRTIATNWEIVTRDEEGATVDIAYICPHCGCSTGVFISVGANSVDRLDGRWETDQTCVVCNEDVIIECS